ncbi:Protein C05C8.1 a [Aphelenchoides avenae]|nr:Protein C05C8.1 a [Aphelenchus avenae]
MLIRSTAELDPRKPQGHVHVVSIDATDASISGFGCRHFEGLDHIVDVRLVRCKNLQDFGLEYMGNLVGSRLSALQIESCPKITEFGLRHLHKFSALQSLILHDLRHVYNPDKEVEALRKALPKCEIKAKIK